MRGGGPPAVCAWCRGRFQPSRRGQRFCCRQCQTRAHNERAKRNGATRATNGTAKPKRVTLDLPDRPFRVPLEEDPVLREELRPPPLPWER
jgi:hypothetical protein